MSYTITKVEPEKVFIVDNDDGSISVTNSAEQVVEELFKRYGNRRFIYKDTMGCWDELEHNQGKFSWFKPYEGKV